ncbi:ATP-dependent RNA helicase dbp10 [Tulasnella sp. 403]|nr:ATP-dependent RNA helicase dbp10 [Tulasnella sp. 403]
MGTDDESGEDVEMTEYTTRPSTSSYRDPEFYLSYEQKDANTDKGYSLKDGASFIQNANAASFDLGNTDEHLTGRLRHNDPSQKLTWSKTKKKFIKGTGEGSDNVKFIRTENGTKLPITYRSGRFDEWKAKSHIRLPRTGEQELPGRGDALSTGRTYKHNKVTEPKPLDPKSIGYERKLRQLKKKEEAAKMLTDGDEGGELEMSNEGGRRKGKGKAGVRFGKPVGKVKSELKSAEVIRKERNVHAKKQSRYGRPSKKKKVKKGK